jgi:hypothetical protein
MAQSSATGRRTQSGPALATLFPVPDSVAWQQPATGTWARQRPAHVGPAVAGPLGPGRTRGAGAWSTTPPYSWPAARSWTRERTGGGEKESSAGMDRGKVAGPVPGAGVIGCRPLHTRKGGTAADQAAAAWAGPPPGRTRAIAAAAASIKPGGPRRGASVAPPPVHRSHLPPG